MCQSSLKRKMQPSNLVSLGAVPIMFIDDPNFFQFCLSADLIGKHKEKFHLFMML